MKVDLEFEVTSQTDDYFVHRVLVDRDEEITDHIAVTLKALIAHQTDEAISAEVEIFVRYQFDGTYTVNFYNMETDFSITIESLNLDIEVHKV